MSDFQFAEAMNRCMAYTKKVNFTTTNNYGCILEDEDDVYTVEEFVAMCKSGGFSDYDGFGYPVNEDRLANSSIFIKPSKLDEIPEEAVYIMWYNR